MNVRDIILELLASEKWRTSAPVDINCGECEEFAWDVLRRCPDCCEMNDEFELNSPGHVWVFCDGLHYDSECPDGISDWSALPIFVRHRQRRRLTTCRPVTQQ